MNASLSEKRFIEIVLEQGYMTEEDILNVAYNCDGLLGEYLVKEKLLTEEQLANIYSQQFRVPLVRLDNYTVNDELYELVPLKIALKLGVVPYQYDGKSLSVVTHDIFNTDIEDKLRAYVRKDINICLGLKSEIDGVLSSKEGGTHLLRDVTEEFRPVLIQDNPLSGGDNISLELVDAESAPAIKIINSLIYAALHKRASDIHLGVYEFGIEIKYRIDGVLYPATERLGIDMHSSLVTRIKVMSSLDITEQYKPQDGRFRLKVDNRNIDFRVSILPGVHGEDVNIRLLDKTTIVSDLGSLDLNNAGFDKESLISVRKAVNEPHGMILITGPTGSGKTTTLYSAVSELNTGEEKIITIEDPVEYQLDGIVQLQVNESRGMTFPKGLRSILRHDPDKILVGEIRDRETAEIAVQSALTGHMVMSSVHANSSFDVVSRFVHMGIDVFSLIPALNCIISQRLVRKICKDCKEEYIPTSEELVLSGLNQDKYDNNKYYKGQGCSSCDDTGYHGRLAIHEILYVSDKIADLYLKQAPLSEIKQTAKSEGMLTLRDAALKKLYAGVTTLHEVNRVTFVA